MQPRISVIAALSSTGEVHLTLTQSNNNSSMMGIFFRELVRKLDKERPLWRDEVVLVMDGAVSLNLTNENLFLIVISLSFFSSLTTRATPPYAPFRP